MPIYHNIWNHPVIKGRSRYPLDIGSTLFTTGGTQGPRYTKGYLEHQRIVTENNPVKGWLGVFQQDVGGPFESKKISVDSLPPGVKLKKLNSSGDVTRLAEGPMCASDHHTKVLREDLNGASDVSQQGTLAAYCPDYIEAVALDVAGATAISRVIPTNPLVDVSVSLAELVSEGYPFDSRLGDFNPGSLYLNYQFGVKPVASDFKKIRDSIALADAHLIKLSEQSGQLLRRRYDYPESTQVDHTVVNGTFPVFSDGRIPDAFIAQSGTRTEVVETSTKIWWSGSFKFHLPQADTWRARLAEFDNTWGAVPDANTAYNLTPWSWLVDYYSNIGDVVKNMSLLTSDGMVMPWSYIMATQTKKVTHSWSGNLLVDNEWKRHLIVSSYTATTLQRRRASPLGFGFTGDLNDRQKLILAALGISRL